MKKTLVVLSTAGILFSGITTSEIVYADGGNTINEESTVNQENVTLTLENVLQKALENDSNLLILNYQLEILDKKKKDAEDNVEDANDELDKLKGNVIPGVKGQYYSAREAYLNQLELLVPQTKMSEMQLASAKEGVRTFVTSRYVQLLSLKEQLHLNDQSMKWLERDLQVLKLRNQMGLSANYEVRDLESEIESLASTIDETQATYDIELIKLLVDLDIPFSENVTLTEIENIKLEPVVKPENVQSLIENSYQMKNAKEELNIAEINLDQNKYSGRYNKQQFQIQVDIAKENISKLETELDNKINTLYKDAESLYRSYNDLVREVSNLEEDQERMRVQYEVGLLSKYDYERFERSLAQKQLQLTTTQWNYYTMLEQIAALQRGYIS